MKIEEASKKEIAQIIGKKYKRKVEKTGVEETIEGINMIAEVREVAKVEVLVF